MLNIYLGDLVYDTIKTNYAIPLNIAYLAASLEQEYADQVEIHLLKLLQFILSLTKVPATIMLLMYQVLYLIGVVQQISTGEAYIML